ncbi:MAG: glycosyl hydrolase 108 family protein, partial [Bacteroidota bacterium]
MASFDTAYTLVAQAEGGYQKFSDDPGNYNSLGQLVGTNWGISAPVYENFIGRPPSEEDMRRMTRGQAKALYRALFWNDIQGDEIVDQQVANIFFDGRVNHGRFGTKLMQRVLRVA